MQSQTLIAVSDVAQSSEWYQTLLGCESVHGGDEYDRLAMPGADGFFLQLHAWGAHDHPNLGDPNTAAHGYGVLLWFLVDDYDATIERILQLDAEIVVPSHVNTRASQDECWIRDPDSYIVVISGRTKTVG